MRKLTALVSIAVLASCALPRQTSGTAGRADAEAPETAAEASPAQRYEYVGTYEQFDTPMGGSISVLMAGGEKIRIVSVDRTRYANIPLQTQYQGRSLKVPIPEIRLGGTYGINGEWKAGFYGAGDHYVVSDMEYLGGGGGIANVRERRHLPDFYVVDDTATGPLTLSELEIRFPESLKRYFNDDEQACFFTQVERRAADMGDPVTLDPHKRVLLFLTREAWERSSVAEKRLQMARYLVSMALGDC